MKYIIVSSSEIGEIPKCSIVEIRLQDSFQTDKERNQVK